MVGLLVAVGTLLLATAIGFALRARDGRVKEKAVDQAVPEEVRALLDPDAAVTLVQLSTTFCAPCRQARVLLADLAGRTGGLAHTDLDLTSQPRLAERLSVLRTPTTLAVDSRGVELLRVSGVPKRAELLAALAPHLPA
ncbi:TlpA family protein disulfide reductase [Actinokineospora bangkokensis]|uniref:Thiol reductase thioredoxin n=1 Tax=Actinokineospora bangkokensis TaxID=1193682 RepID=A0A1Q9LFS3_9PSEU|nr:thioredoxin family protein [Actinokineospora bangkokensis]OLR90864.1 thiol reductase thioredoxin [Actinokineospora bangkokensis]